MKNPKAAKMRTGRACFVLAGVAAYLLIGMTVFATPASAAKMPKRVLGLWCESETQEDKEKDGSVLYYRPLEYGESDCKEEHLRFYIGNRYIGQGEFEFACRNVRTIAIGNAWHFDLWHVTMQCGKDNVWALQLVPDSSCEASGRVAEIKNAQQD